METIESIEHPGYYVTTHKKPNEYTLSDWNHMVKCYHTKQGSIIKGTVTYSNPVFDKPSNEHGRKEVSTEFGIEVIWRPWYG